jgi:phage shock protein A
LHEEIARLKKELEEEKKKTAALEQSLASATKTTKQLATELEYVKSKIATAVARKESATSESTSRMSTSGSSSPAYPLSLSNNAITNNNANNTNTTSNASLPSDGRMSKVAS